MTDSQTTLDSLRSVRPIIDKMNQHLLDNVKKCVDQEVVVVKFKRTGHKLADPLDKRIKIMQIWTMSCPPDLPLFRKYWVFSPNSDFFYWILFYLALP